MENKLAAIMVVMAWKLLGYAIIVLLCYLYVHSLLGLGLLVLLALANYIEGVARERWKDFLDN